MENKPNLDYDSINTGDGGHFIVYENNKAYPGYLITYLWFSLFTLIYDSYVSTYI